MQYWIMKTEPETFSFADLMHDGTTIWDGVRSYEARNNLRKMKVGDLVWIYHSMKEKSVVGLATVTEEAFPDPSDDTGVWSSVRIAPVRPVVTPLSLADIKQDDVLKTMDIVRKSRLSVSEMTEKHHFCIEKRVFI